MKVPDNLPYRDFPAKVLLWTTCFVFVPTAVFMIGCQQVANQPQILQENVEVSKPRLFEYRRPAMGVELVIQVWCSDDETASKAIQAADARVEELEQVLSNYRSDSEVSLLTESLAKGPVVVSKDFWRVLKQAEQGWESSDEAFDVTIAPLADLWRAARKSGRLPTSDQIDKAREQLGFDKLKLDEARRSVDSSGAAISFDFGAIGKGDAADEALAVLKRHGIESALVELGGDMAIGAAPPGRTGWRIAVDALGVNAAATHFIEVANCGVATSGDKHQFVEIDGVRYSHIINPKTGMALRRSSLVTVVAPTGWEADTFASVFSLLEPDAAVALANSLDGTFVRGEVASGEKERVIFSSAVFPELQPMQSKEDENR